MLIANCRQQSTRPGCRLLGSRNYGACASVLLTSSVITKLLVKVEKLSLTTITDRSNNTHRSLVLSLTTTLRYVSKCSLVVSDWLRMSCHFI